MTAEHIEVRPTPTDDELAAILAAYAELWPAVEDPSAAAERVDTSWRFSGRWWIQPIGAVRPTTWTRG